MGKGNGYNYYNEPPVINPALVTIKPLRPQGSKETDKEYLWFLARTIRDN